MAATPQRTAGGQSTPTAVPANPENDRPPAAGVVGLTHRLATSPRLRQRRYELLPLRGPNAVFTDTQGRGPGDATTPAGLADLISSIAAVGILQPILVEEQLRPGAAPVRLLVTGERRLRSARWGAVHLPGNDHFAAVPAVVCPGPLTEEDRRVWQLVENLAREDLRPGELGAALLFERCAVLAAQLQDLGRPVPADLFTVDDPVERWRALERVRGGDPTVGAPWETVLSRLGLQLSERKARQLHAALCALPPEISEQMDKAKITLHTRLQFAALQRGRTAAATDIWAAVRDLGRPDLLPGALASSRLDQTLTAAQALEAAAERQAAGNAARAAALTRTDHADGGPTGTASTVPAVPAADPESARGVAGAGGDASRAATTARHALADLIAVLRTGGQVARYDLGSLRLLAGELLTLLPAEV